MASARKKQDEKHLKILRELVSLPANKECFDCHQRGPTYVNMTIGSFVCTSCSGLLRGLTPPHRVKSISMATFSVEEIDLIRTRGNDYCRRTWLGLYDANTSITQDEQQVRAFMVAKYEKKRYYLELSAASTINGPVNFSPPATQTQSRTSTPTPVAQPAFPDVKPLSNLLGQTVKPLVFNTTQLPSNPANMFTPDKSPSEFTAGFGKPDPFSSSQFASSVSQASFADFDNNPVFNQANAHITGNAAGVPARFNTNRWSMPTAAALANMSPFASPARKSASSMGVSGMQPAAFSRATAGQPTAEDRYAALKDLDSQMKSQQSEAPQLNDWSTAVSTSGSVWTASNSQTTSNSGQAGFTDASSTVNPFTAATASNRNPWTPVVSTVSALKSTQGAADGFGANPFRAMRTGEVPFGVPTDGFQAWGAPGPNGVPNGVPNGQVSNGMVPVAYHSSLGASVFPTSQSMTFAAKPWQAHPPRNPFALGASPSPAARSSNPFL